MSNNAARATVKKVAQDPKKSWSISNILWKSTVTFLFGATIVELVYVGIGGYRWLNKVDDTTVERKKIRDEQTKRIKEVQQQTAAAQTATPPTK